MKAGKTLWWVAVGCGVLLLLAPMTPRTSWIHRDGGGMTHSAGWDWIAPFAGVVAIALLCIGAANRQRTLVAISSIAVAAIAFAAATAAAAGHWGSLLTGAMEIEGWTLYPAPAVGQFTVIAAVGTVCSLVLLGTWLRPGEDEW